jgi:hypothetical protein
MKSYRHSWNSNRRFALPPKIKTTYRNFHPNAVTGKTIEEAAPLRR